MIRYAFLFLVLLVTAQPAAAQPQPVPQPTYTFIVTTDEANMMLNQLGKLDWVTVNPLLQKLISQLQTQDRARQAPAAPPPPKD